MKLLVFLEFFITILPQTVWATTVQGKKNVGFNTGWPTNESWTDGHIAVRSNRDYRGYLNQGMGARISSSQNSEIAIYTDLEQYTDASIVLGMFGKFLFQGGSFTQKSGSALSAENHNLVETSNSKILLKEHSVWSLQTAAFVSLIDSQIELGQSSKLKIGFQSNLIGEQASITAGNKSLINLETAAIAYLIDSEIRMDKNIAELQMGEASSLHMSKSSLSTGSKIQIGSNSVVTLKDHSLLQFGLRKVSGNITIGSLSKFTIGPRSKFLAVEKNLTLGDQASLEVVSDVACIMFKDVWVGDNEKRIISVDIFGDDIVCVNSSGLNKPKLWIN